jgi:hypothetical protein
VKRDDVTATLGSARVDVYQDPRFPDDLVLIEGNYCWLVHLDRKQVAAPGCSIFEISSARVRLAKKPPPDQIADIYWNDEGRVIGRAWEDVAADCASWVTQFFRRPRFRTDTVSFWACDGVGWAEIKLPGR